MTHAHTQWLKQLCMFTKHNIKTFIFAWVFKQAVYSNLHCTTARIMYLYCSTFVCLLHIFVNNVVF